jgi:hypothetical protein
MSLFIATLASLKPRTWWRSMADRIAHHRAEARARALTRAAEAACAPESVDVLEFGVVELDGRRYGALYRGGRLACLLPDTDRL